MNKRKLICSLLLLCIFSTMIPTDIFADTVYDYKEYIGELILQYGDFKTPESQFEIYVNGTKTATSPMTENTVETVEELPLSFTCNLGDSLDIRALTDSSHVGSGSKIVKYDFQVGKNHTYSGFESYEPYNSSNLEIQADTPGKWVVFLNVCDNYSGIPNFENWSQYGNWRTTYQPPYQPSGVKIEGWYFTAVKFEVIDTSKPIADFEIRYNGQNVTDNSSNPMGVDSYPINVQLMDNSTCTNGTITGWEWYSWSDTTNKWELFSNIQSPPFTVNAEAQSFKLITESSNGVKSDPVIHTFFSYKEAVGTINAIITGKTEIEKGRSLTLDSSSSFSTYPIVKREWYRSTVRDFVYYPKWDDAVSITDQIDEDTTKKYYEYKLIITDSKGSSDEAIHRVNIVDKIEEGATAVLTYDTVFPESIDLTWDDIKNDTEFEITAWVHGENSFSNKSTIQDYWYWAEQDESELPVNGSEVGFDKHVEYIDDPDWDSFVPLKFKVKPSDPNIMASLRVRDRRDNYGTTTAYYTYQFVYPKIKPPSAYIDAPDEIPINIDFMVKSDSEAIGDGNVIEKTTWNVTPSGFMTGELLGEENTVSFNTEGEYTIELTVEDLNGLTDTDTHIIKVIPDVPTAVLTWNGTNKQNRKVIFDSTNSISSVSGQLILDYTKNKWEITPLEEQSQDSICIVDSPDLKTREVLFKESGDYKVRLQIENTGGFISEWVEMIINIASDLPPIADFEVTNIVVRDINNENKAKIELIDKTVSPDDDIIINRVWQYRYDSNNNKDFTDEGWGYFDIGNNTNPILYTEPNNVGKYQFKLHAIEQFKEETIKVFIKAEDTRTDDSEEKECEVVNLAPTTSFETIVNPLADVSTHIVSGNNELLGNFEDDSNNLIINLKNQSIDIQDGKFIDENETALTTTERFRFYFRASRRPFIDSSLTSLNYNWHTGIGDSGKIMKYYNSTSNDCFTSAYVSVSYYQTVPESKTTPDYYPRIYYSYDGNKWKELSVRYTGGYSTWSKISDSSYSAKAFDFTTSYIREDFRYIKVCNRSNSSGTQDIVNVYSPVKGVKEITKAPVLNIAKLKSDIENFTWRDNSNRYTVLISDSTASLNTTDTNNIINQYKDKNIKVIFVGNSNNLSKGQQIANETGGQFFAINSNTIPWQDIEDYIKQDILNNKHKTRYILLDEVIEYETHYSDPENDPYVQERWIYAHDESVFDNSLGKADFSDQYLNTSINQFNKVGRYTAMYQALDKPKDNICFNDYMKWSNTDGDLDIYVHRKPIAQFNIKYTKINTTTYSLDLEDDSYDLDHEFSANKGIIEWEWKWKESGKLGWNDGKPTSVMSNKTYEVFLRVKDEEQAWSEPYIETINILTIEPEINAELHTELDKFDGDNIVIPSSEELKVTNIMTKNINTVSQVQFALYDGSIQRTPYETLTNPDDVIGGDSIEVTWSDIRNYAIPQTLPDDTYIAKIKAEDGLTDKEKEWVIKVKTPINLTAHITSEISTNSTTQINASTTKYAHEVIVDVYDEANVLIDTISLTSVLNGSNKDWTVDYLVPEVPDGMYTFKFTARTPNNNIEIKTLKIKINSLEIISATLMPQPALAGDELIFTIQTKGYAERIEIVVPDDMVAKDDIPGKWNRSGKYTYPLVFNVNENIDEKTYVLRYITSVKIDKTLTSENVRLREPYRFIVRAYKGEIMKEKELTLDVRRCVLDLIKIGVKSVDSNGFKIIEEE